MKIIPIHCSQCGARFQITDTFPKKCPNTECSHEDYGNVRPVSVFLGGFRDRALLVRREIEPGYGMLACPGGYTEHAQTMKVAASVEVRQESERIKPGTKEVIFPGLVFDPDELCVLDEIGVPHLNLTLQFYVLARRGLEGRIEDWFEQAQPHLRDNRERGTIWNKEVQTIEALTQQQVADTQIAFPAHREMLNRWFVMRGGLR